MLFECTADLEIAMIMIELMLIPVYTRLPGSLSGRV